MSADVLKARWLLCEEEVGCVLADIGAKKGKPDILQVDVNSGLTDEAVEAIARHIADLHNASLSPQADPWIELSTLGDPRPSVWPWNGDRVLVSSRSIIPGEPDMAGQARFMRGRADAWGWWWTGHSCYRDPPIGGSDGPVTHVRRIVPPMAGA